MSTLYDRARALMEMRRRRDTILGHDLFGEPAWDILLDLYTSEVEGKQVKLSALGLLAGIAPTTMMRWTAVLVNRGLINRSSDDRDQRIRIVSLSDAGRARIEQVLMHSSDS
ncbi:MarR family transcriptional regulator [Sphingomonas montanisoli]|uniref:Transcriptional regulator n=1 Tax=Sphingomonas montanisoli TaxID=2606412 RepID=A0A5D9CBW9_9SPHN|nr:MarR family transcriptional regulator [Sphingomonas montanisoli]TZG28733.1 transcriptional regulator [Sphingomonas montanisoli]